MDTEELFNLEVHDAGVGRTEVFQNVSANKGQRRLDKVLKDESQLVEVKSTPSDKLRRPGKSGDITHADKGWWHPDNAGAYSPASGGDDGQESLDPIASVGEREATTGIYALEKADIFNRNTA